MLKQNLIYFHNIAVTKTSAEGIVANQAKSKIATTSIWLHIGERFSSLSSEQRDNKVYISKQKFLCNGFIGRQKKTELSHEKSKD